MSNFIRPAPVCDFYGPKYRSKMKMRMKLSPMIVYGLAIATLVVIAYMARWRPFEGFSAAADGTFYVVYASWCPHCKDILPAMEAMAASGPMSVNGKTVNFKLVESEEKAELAKLPKVSGFPTMMFKPATGEFQEYSGNRDESSIKSWLASVL